MLDSMVQKTRRSRATNRCRVNCLKTTENRRLVLTAFSTVVE